MTKYILILIIFQFTFFSCNTSTQSNNTQDTSKKEHNSIDELSKLISSNPNNADLYNQRAMLYIAINNIDSAFRDINQALTLDSNKADFYVTLSDIYMASGMVQNTLAALEKSLLKEPTNNNALLKKAELHLYFNQFGETLNLTEEAIKIHKINPKAYFIRGMTFKMRGDTANAVKNLQMCVDQDQDYYHAFIQLGLLYAARSNPLAIDYYNNALNINPQSIEALYNLGYFYQEHDMLNEALNTYTSILTIDSTFKHAHYNMGYIHMVYLEIYREAIKYFNKAIANDPNFVEAYYNRGYCFELLGDINNARVDYNKALTIRVNYELAIEGLNRIDK